MRCILPFRVVLLCHDVPFNTIRLHSIQFGSSNIGQQMMFFFEEMDRTTSAVYGGCICVNTQHESNVGIIGALSPADDECPHLGPKSPSREVSPSAIFCRRVSE